MKRPEIVESGVGGALGISPSHSEFYLDAKSSIDVNFKSWFFTGDLEITLDELADITVEPTIVPVVDKVDGYPVTLTFHGGPSLVTEDLVGYVGFLALFDTYGIRIRVKATIHRNAAISPTKANINGVVKDAETGELLSDVLVELNGHTIYTDSNGYYLIKNLTLGACVIRFSKSGYKTHQENIWLAFPGVIVPYDASLIPVPVKYLSVTIDGNGVVDPLSGEFEEGTVVTLTAVPVEGWQFDSWEGTDNDAINPTTVTMTSDKHVVAIFTEIPLPPPEMASMTGIVTDEETTELLPDVLVALNGYKTYTGPDGFYLTENIEPGDYTIKFSKSGYETKESSITLVEGINTLDVSLKPKKKISWLLPTGIVAAAATVITVIAVAVTRGRK